CLRNPGSAMLFVVVRKYRSIENSRLDVFLIGVVENVILQSLPEIIALVKTLVLRAAVCPVKCIVICQLSHATPDRIEPPGQMASVEVVSPGNILVTIKLVT